MVPKRCETEGMALLYAPSAPTDANASSSASRGTRTRSNHSWTLLTPARAGAHLS